MSSDMRFNKLEMTTKERMGWNDNLWENRGEAQWLDEEEWEENELNELNELNDLNEPEDEKLEEDLNEKELNPQNKDVDPLYDEQADEEDEKWVDKNISKYLPEDARKSDALLSCPCCFTLLCAHCQRHETYLNQYRAIFVRNCRVDPSKEMKYKKQPLPLSKTEEKKEKLKKMKESKRRKKEEQKLPNSVPPPLESSTPNTSYSETDQQTFGQSQIQKNEDDEEGPFELVDHIYVENEHLYENEIYCPVYCSTCGIQVGVMDHEETYHFFNVIPSEC